MRALERKGREISCEDEGGQHFASNLNAKARISLHSKTKMNGASKYGRHMINNMDMSSLGVGHKQEWREEEISKWLANPELIIASMHAIWFFIYIGGGTTLCRSGLPLPES
ncbi:hypothetical protein LR48_Vigan08g023700 [Vigna angularis]|uniref:Uncharacterized protein n=1 Tax=Phaseolus angularis TaxID=3914 RepID=A0A0L9V2T8_PHAAN|nr:hypothetical protein LR48_Vigan08g023700 [Vigna angularis]